MKPTVRANYLSDKNKVKRQLELLWEGKYVPLSDLSLHQLSFLVGEKTFKMKKSKSKNNPHLNYPKEDIKILQATLSQKIEEFVKKLKEKMRTLQDKNKKYKKSEVYDFIFEFKKEINKLTGFEND